MSTKTVKILAIMAAVLCILSCLLHCYRGDTPRAVFFGALTGVNIYIILNIDKE